MNFDWLQPMWDKIRAISPFGRDDMESNMANGGFSGYKPNTAKHRAMRETQQQTAVQDFAQNPMMTGMNWEQTQQMTQQQAAAFGGYTSTMQPQEAYQQPTGYQTPMNGYTNVQQPMQGFQGGATVPFQPMNSWQEQQPMQGYQEPANQGFGGQQGFGNTVPFNPVGQNNQYPPQPEAQSDNISYMPGNFVGDDGKAYSHCERVAVISNVSMCYRIIEFMRNNESVIVSTEQITDEAENQRCLDLLYGAAFVMKCSFTRVAAKSIYLIAPATVMVVPYDSVRRMSDQDINSRWPDNSVDGIMNELFGRREDRYGAQPQGGYTYGARQQGYGRQQEGYVYGRHFAHQDEYAPYGGYQAAGYGR